MDIVLLIVGLAVGAAAGVGGLYLYQRSRASSALLKRKPGANSPRPSNGRARSNAKHKRRSDESVRRARHRPTAAVPS